MDVKRRFEAGSVIISVPSIGRERFQDEIAINGIADENGADFHHVSPTLHLSRPIFHDRKLIGGAATWWPKASHGKILKSRQLQ
jgi:hypothetical protein